MRYLFVFTITILFVSCATHPASVSDEPVSPGISIKHLRWLTGTWKSVTNNETSFEIWEIKNDTLMTGHGFTLVNNDTTFSEHLQIVQRGKDLFYIPAVTNQNNGQPVPFRFKEFNKGEFNFVNKNHDFPQRIIYKNPQPDFLCARIEGTKNAKFQKIDFNFLKVKN